MLIDYYLASGLGALWFRLHPSLRNRIGDRPALCRKAAANRQIEAADLLKAQIFATGVWWRAAIAAALLFLPVIGLAAVVRPGRVGTDVGGAIVLILGAAAAVAMGQMIMLSIRSNLTAGYLRRGNTEPLDAYQGGYPTRYDFWIAAGVALAIYGLLGYAGLAR